MKPFKPLTIAARRPSDHETASSATEPPAKRRRVNRDPSDDNTEAVNDAVKILKVQKSPKPVQRPAPSRKPLDEIVPPNGSQGTQNGTSSTDEGYFTVLW